MNRRWFVFAVLVAFAFVAVQPLSAQMGMDMFKRPAITKVFHPVVGKGAAYLDTDKDGRPPAPAKSRSSARIRSKAKKVSGCRFTPPIPRAKPLSARA